MSAYAVTETLDAALGDDGVLRITFRKPKKKNAVDDEMMAGVTEHLRIANSDEAVRAIILSGEGDDFCSGLDIVGRNASKERPRVGSIQRRLPWQAHQLIPTMVETQVPIIVEARGWTVGIGLNMALAADFAIAAHDSTLWAPFSTRGFTPDSGASWLLPRVIGPVRARRMLVLGERVDGRTAAEWNMVHSSVPGDKLTETVESLASQLAGGPTVALGLTKWLLHTGETLPLREHLSHEALAIEISSRAEDFREGLTAFVEKRPPDFSGR